MSSTLPMTRPAIQAFEPLFRRLADDYKIANFDYPRDLSLPEREGIKGHRDLPLIDGMYRCMYPGDMEYTYLADAENLLTFAESWPVAELLESGLARLIRELLVLVEESALSEMNALSETLGHTFAELDYNDHSDRENGFYYSNQADRHVADGFGYYEAVHLRNFDAYMDGLEAQGLAEPENLFEAKA